MKISNVFSSNKKYIENITNFFVDIVKELSLIIWVAIVFLLIVWSYAVNSTSLSQNPELKLYEQVSPIGEIY